MNRYFLLLAPGLLFASMAFAQEMPGSTTPSSQPQQPQAGGQSAAQSTVIRGCLSGSAGNYTVTDQNGVQYKVLGSENKLQPKVGHEVEITGTESPSSEASSQGSDSMSHPANGLQAAAVRDVSDTCKKMGGSLSPHP